MSEGQCGGLFADFNMAFLKSKRGLLKVAQMVSVSAHRGRFNLPFKVSGRKRGGVDLKYDTDFLGASSQTS